VAIGSQLLIETISGGPAKAGHYGTLGVLSINYHQSTRNH